MATPKIGVLAIQGDVREHMNHLSACGVDTILVKTPEALSEIDGLVIPGGESTTMSILAVKNSLIEPLREARKQIPMYGSCAGLIMLADEITDGRDDQETIGGLNVTARRNAFGRQVDSFEIDLNIAKIGEPPFHAVFIRAPLVEKIGAGVEVLAQLPTEHEDRIVAVRENNLLATSFHPELVNDLRIHEYFIEMVRKA
jgi:5'-phosphate synthase pdxT subunit